MRITKNNTIGLVIDMQEKLVPVMVENEFLIRNNEILIQGLQELEIPIVVTQQYSQGLGETIEPIKSLLKDFNPIEKKDYSCYDVEAFTEKCKALGARNVIISGIEAHICVLQTAIDLEQAGLTPIVLMDAISSRSLDNVDIAADRFRYEHIMMSSVESILFELMRSASNPHFKTISKLIK